MDHNTMLTMWIIAGFCVGWMGIDILLFKKTTPMLYQLVSGFIGALIAYSILS